MNIEMCSIPNADGATTVVNTGCETSWGAHSAGPEERTRLFGLRAEERTRPYNFIINFENIEHTMRYIGWFQFLYMELKCIFALNGKVFILTEF